MLEYRSGLFGNTFNSSKYYFPLNTLTKQKLNSLALNQINLVRKNWIQAL